jgi:hypothetical protein
MYIPSTSIAAGTNTQVQFNDGGLLGGDADFTFNKTTNQIAIATGSAAAPTLIPTGDTNTGLFFPAADTIAFAEGGAEAMRITSAGNVGIGTSAPAAKLDVAGGIISDNITTDTELDYNYATASLPVNAPALDLNFAGSETVDSRVTFTRSTTATFFGSNGLLQSAAINVPRIDFNPTTLECLGLLVEEQRTNLLINSNSFSSWSENASTRTLNSFTSPDGTVTASLLSMTSATTSGLFVFPTVVNGTTYTFSGFFKAVSGSPILTIGAQANPTNGFVTFNTATGVITAAQAGVISSSVVNYGNGWYRVTVTVTATSTTIGIVVYNATGSAASVYIWGAQLETGTFATSYIPTAAASVTRNADVASVATSQFPYNATEGALVVSADYIGQNPGVTYFAALDDGTTNNFMGVRRNPGGDPSLINVVSGVNQVTLISAVVANNTAFKSSFAYKLNDYALTLNGSLSGTDTSATVPSVSRLSLGNIANILQMSGHIRQITYFPRRLSNAELQAVSTP